MGMPSARKFVTKFISLRRPQYIGLKHNDYDARGIPVRIWAWADDDGIHVTVQPDSFGMVVYNEYTKTIHSEIKCRIIEQPIPLPDSLDEPVGSMGSDNTDIFMEG